ncbi:MAG: sterol desaturase family protein [Myxococcales bacterium]|nr:sterol desaturase family protein [Myxococcales bacterium]
MTDPIVLSIPAFFLLMGVELALARRRGRRVYRAADAINNLHLGVGSQIVGVMSLGATLALYTLVWDHAALFEVPLDSALAWIAAFIGVDFLYYWFHRKSHEIGFLWAAHAVHHQSEDYNLSVALRQSWLQPFFSIWFYLPLAILGVPPLMFATVVALDTLYQFWIHTELIHRMGPLERVLNTPSHHRVHHGTDARYVDRNHAGVLIVWDKLFGTFEPEGERPRYGTLAPLRSFEPLWANLQVWRLLIDKARAARGWRDKLRAFFAPPGWLPEGVPAPPTPDGLPTDPGYVLYDRPLRGSRALYVGLQFTGMIAAAIGLLYAQHTLAPAATIAWGAAILWTVIAVGGVIDGRRWAPRLEAARLAAIVAGGAGLWASDTAPLIGAILFLGGLASTVLGAWTARRAALDEAPLPERA